MTADTDLHPLARDYLGRLADAARILPDRGEELVSDIAGHLHEALSPDAGEAEVRTVLDRLGTPTELVGAAGGAGAQTATPATGAAGPRQVGAVEVLALVLLVVAELAFVLSFLVIPLWVAGLVLLAVSRVWSGREKLQGLFFVGTGFPLVLASMMTTTSVTYSSCTGAQPVVSTDDDGTQTVSCSTEGGWPDWANAVALGLLVAYVCFQAWTVWRLTRRR